MGAGALLEFLSSRGFTVLAKGGAIRVSPSAALTDEDRHTIRNHKAELLALLQSKPERPPLGSLARPVVCYSDQLYGCPWHTCGGELERAGDYYQCRICKTWFELKPADFGALCR